MLNRLYIDLDGNGDLTDDEVVKTFNIRAYNANYGRSYFKVSLPVERDGEKFEIPCKIDTVRISYLFFKTLFSFYLTYNNFQLEEVYSWIFLH